MGDQIQKQKAKLLLRRIELVRLRSVETRQRASVEREMRLNRYKTRTTTNTPVDTLHSIAVECLLHVLPSSMDVLFLSMSWYIVSDPIAV